MKKIIKQIIDWVDNNEYKNRTINFLLIFKMKNKINEECKTLIEVADISYNKERKYNIFSQSIKKIIFIVFLILYTIIRIICHKKFKQMKLLKIIDNYNSEYLLISHPKWMGIKIATFQINLPLIEIKKLSNKYVQDFLIKLIIDNSFKFIIINDVIAGSLNFSSRINRLFSDVKTLLTYRESFSINEGIKLNSAIKYIKKE